MTSSRYDPIAKIASGGMATVFLGALRGPMGFRQLVALKRPHEHLLEDRAFKSAFVSEARLAALVHHANVVDVRDIEETDRGIQLVMDYVEGASLGQLLVSWAQGGPVIAAPVALKIVLDACAGLHAAHELVGDDGQPLGLVHRDVSPQNILVGVDGVARVTDFGLAKCNNVGQGATTQGTLKGKIGYMAPEYVRGRPTDRRADVFAMGVVAWETLCKRRLFRGETEPDTIDRILHETPPPVSSVVPELSHALDAPIARALAKDPADRFGSMAELAAALEAAARPLGLIAERTEVGALVRAAFGRELDERRTLASRSETSIAAVHANTPTTPPKRSARRPAVAIATALAVAALAIAAAASALRHRSAPPAAPPPPAVATPEPAPRAETPDPNATPLASSPPPDPRPLPARPPPPVTSPRPRGSGRPHLPPPNPYAPK